MPLPPLSITILPTIEAVTASQWDSLVDTDQPFLRHGFLHALEASGSVSMATGWEPCHLSVWQGEQLVAAMPMYRHRRAKSEHL